jgi:hypothetical protein
MVLTLCPSWTGFSGKWSGKFALKNARSTAKKLIRDRVAEGDIESEISVEVFNVESEKTILYFIWLGGEIAEFEGEKDTETEAEEFARAQTENFTASLTDEQVHRLLPKVLEIVAEFGVETPNVDSEKIALQSENSTSAQLEPVDKLNPDTITIEFPSANVQEDILRSLLNSKQSLIEAALGEDCAWAKEYGTDGLPLTDLPIEFADSKVKFEWLKFGVTSEAITAWSAFLASAVKFSKTAKRVTAKDEGFDEENGKFQFRIFCVKIGMNGAEHKWARKFILRNLKGSSSFATQESADRWQEKHGKKAEKVEVNSDEISE